MVIFFYGALSSHRPPFYGILEAVGFISLKGGIWQEVFITQDVEQFMMVSEALQNAGIRFKSTTGGQEFNGRKSAKASNLPSISYSILVAEEKAQLAQQKINEVTF